MNAEIISIGFELLNGRTVNTNASTIAKALIETGVITRWITTIPDEETEIAAAVKMALKRADIIITTGGLGPTNDDITKEIITRTLGGNLVFDEAIFTRVKKRFASFGVQMPATNRNQAMVPDNARVLINEMGTAPGLLFEPQNKLVFVLPGVPKEMTFLMETAVIPRVRPLVKTKAPKSMSFRTTGIGESALYEKVQDVLQKYPQINFMFYPEFTGVELKISGYSEDEMQQAGQAILERAGNFIYSREDGGSLQKTLGDLLRNKKKTIAVAESCSGGLLGHLLTSVPGASEYFMGGVISYSNRAKVASLQVQEDTLMQFGAVSEPTAKEMAEGVRSVFSADIGVSVTGIAGPSGGTSEKPVGLVYIGLAHGNTVTAHRFNFGGDREMNKLRSAAAAMNLVRLKVISED